MLDYESDKLSKEKKEERRAVECSSKERWVGRVDSLSFPPPEFLKNSLNNESIERNGALKIWVLKGWFEGRPWKTSDINKSSLEVESLNLKVNGF